MATDIRIYQSITPFEINLDWLMLPNGTLDESQEMATAVIVALGTDGLADPDVVLPGIDDTDRRGWWGDLDAEEIWGGWPIGSQLWTLTRSKITETLTMTGEPTVVQVEEFARQAIWPFQQRHMCTSFTVEAARTARDRIDCLIRIYRGPLPEIDLRYQVLWEQAQAGE